MRLIGRIHFPTKRVDNFILRHKIKRFRTCKTGYRIETKRNRFHLIIGFHLMIHFDQRGT